MKNINDIMAALLTNEQDRKEISEAVQAALDSAKTDLEKQYDANLQEAYAELAGQLKDAEKTAENGYQEALSVITDLRNRIGTQKDEFETALEEGYEEAYQMLQQERTKREGLENDLYGEYDKKLAEMREYMIDKVDEFLQYKGKEIYEQAKRDVLNDPRMAEHRVTLNKVVETVADYISDEEFALATSNKLEKVVKEASELKNQVKLLEARNIRISTENTKLTESVRQQGELIKENAGDKKARIESGKNASGRGRSANPENVEVIKENLETPAAKKEQAAAPIVEGVDWNHLKTLAGIRKPEDNK